MSLTPISSSDEDIGGVKLRIDDVTIWDGGWRQQGHAVSWFPRLAGKVSGERSFSFAAPMIWNTLPEHIRNSSSLFLENSLKLIFFPLKLLVQLLTDLLDWYTFESILIIIIAGRSIELRLGSLFDVVYWH